MCCLIKLIYMTKISVITVCRNCVGEIEKTLKSVLAQTYSNIEYIVVDGASSDGTLDIINRYKSKISMLVSEPDKGIYNAMNKGVRLATGRWCIFMNAGDKFASDNVVSEMFASNSPKDSTKVYYGNTTYAYEDGTMKSFKATLVYPIILRCQPYCHQSAFFNIEDKRSPFFDEQYKIVSDYNTSLWYFTKYGEDAFEYRNMLISEFAAFGGASTSEKNSQRKNLEFLNVWKHYSVCRKRYLIERFKYFIIYQQPFSIFKSLLKRYVKNRTIKDANARRVN